MCLYQDLDLLDHLLCQTQVTEFSGGRTRINIPAQGIQAPRQHRSPACPCPIWSESPAKPPPRLLTPTHCLFLCMLYLAVSCNTRCSSSPSLASLHTTGIRNNWEYAAASHWTRMQHLTARAALPIPQRSVASRLQRGESPSCFLAKNSSSFTLKTPCRAVTVKASTAFQYRLHMQTLATRPAPLLAQPVTHPGQAHFLLSLITTH